jgi:threonine dehydrogenase-like Zn-dependent dehydrogenase
MLEHVLAATKIGAWKTEARESPFPRVTADGGILRVEAAGVCGSDWQSYQAARPRRVMCREIVGRTYRIGRAAASRRERREGDRLTLAMRFNFPGRFSLYLMATHRFDLANVDLARRSVGGQDAPGTVQVTVLPWN